MNKLMLIINLGSTSSKTAVYSGDGLQAEKTFKHSDDISGLSPIEQLSERRQCIEDFLDASGVDISHIEIIVSRGGLGKPGPAGIYEISETMCDDLMRGRFGLHASATGPKIAFDMAQKLGVKAIVVDPPSTDEFDEISRYSGLPDIQRKSAFHALSHKACARRFAEESNRKYDELRLIVAHMGGGITIGAHLNGKVVDCTHGLSEGPFTPERAGGLPTMELLEMAFSGTADLASMKKKLAGTAGLRAYSGSSSAEALEEKINNGDSFAKNVYRAMAYQISKDICAMAACLSGMVDAVILTGGLAFSKMLTGWIIERVSFLGSVVVYPGEDEMSSLARGGLRALNGLEEIKRY